MVIIFDTETTGVPRNYKAPFTDLDNWPRIIQLAWEVRNNDGELLNKECILIKPVGWEIPKEKFWIDNGFLTEDSLANGTPIESALRIFMVSVRAAGLIVAHNIKFDMPILQAELLRAGMDSEIDLDQLCTMMSTVDVLRVPSAYGFKWPK